MTYTNRPPPGLRRNMRRGETTTLRINGVEIHITASKPSTIYIDAPKVVTIHWPPRVKHEATQTPEELS